jgi:large subunit ribosomal protein L9
MEVFSHVKVILIADVYKHGVAGEVVDVADGYARNYLIPQQLALKATAGALRQAEKLRQDAKARRARMYKEMEGIAELVQGAELSFPVKAGSSGKLYGSVTMGDVADALNEKLNLELDRRRIGEGSSIRELGIHNVRVRLASDLAPTVKVTVYPEGESPESVMEIEEEELEAAAIETVGETVAEVEDAPEAQPVEE